MSEIVISEQLYALIQTQKRTLIQVEHCDTIPQGYTESTPRQRQCLLDADLLELKLVTKCSECNKYVEINQDNFTRAKCHTHGHGNCYRYPSQCRTCSNDWKNKRNQEKSKATKINPDSRIINKKKARSNLKKERRLKDENFRNKLRIIQQEVAFESRKKQRVLYAEWYTSFGLEYGQCLECGVINAFLIECDHSELLIGENESKVACVCKIDDLTLKAAELKKTQPLCIKCHSKKTHTFTHFNQNNKHTNQRLESAIAIQNAKAMGCVCCNLPNPSEDLGLFYWFFELDHIDNSTKAEWFKKTCGFNLSHSEFKHGQPLIDEIAKCQSLCRECHTLKTYLEHPMRHSLTKHQYLMQYSPNFVNWYKETYANNPVMLSHLYSERGKTNDFVPILSDLPYRPKN